MRSDNDATKQQEPPASAVSDEPGLERKQPWKAFFQQIRGEEGARDLITIPLPDSSSPYEVISEAPAELPTINFTTAPAAPETIHDIRGREQDFNLENHGFQALRSPLTVTSFDDKMALEEVYLSSLVTLLKGVFDPSTEAYVFDWRFRTSDRSKSTVVPGAVVDLDDPLVRLTPVNSVHVDQSHNGAINRVRHHLGDERADELLKKKRFRIVNIWRPLYSTVENFPLAVCDGSSVPTEKLLTVDHVRKTYVGESYYPLPSPDQYRWYYLNRQTPDEVLMFKTYDSDTKAPARCCPHTSFAQSGVGPEAKPRQSIEVRTLVFTDE
ncbi:putative 7 alpha-cephem-methoxylase [Rhypophila decipiens]